jgi:hypothetical protein
MKRNYKVNGDGIRGVKLLRFIIEEQAKAGHEIDQFTLILASIVDEALAGNVCKAHELTALLDKLDNESGRARIRERCFKENKGKRTA